MKALYNWFLKHKTLILVGFTVILFSAVATCQYSGNRAEVKAIKAEQAKNELKIRNEVQSYYLERKNAELDSLKSIEAAKTWKARTDALIYKSEVIRLKESTRTLEEKYNQLVAENAPCPDLLNAALVRIDTLKRENFTLERECESLDIESEGYSRQLYMCEQQRINSDTLLVSARAEVKAGDLVIKSLKKVEQKKEFREKVVRLVGGAVMLLETVVLVVKSM